MNFIICLIIVSCFFLLKVKCRSLQVNNDVHSESEITDDVNHDLENGGRPSWKKLKPILRREVQLTRNLTGMEANLLNHVSTDPTVSIPSVKDKKMPSKNQKNEEISVIAESQTNITSSTELETATKNQREVRISESDLPGDIASDITPLEKVKLDPSLTTYEFPDKILSDILNRSGDSLVFQALNDNSSKSFEFDETAMLSDGGQVATLQGVSTIGSELLIDSETNQNLILTELISSQLNLIDDDDGTSSDFTHEDSSSSSVALIFNNESEETTNGRTTSNPDIAESNTDESGKNEIDVTSSFEANGTELSNTDEIGSEDTEIDITSSFQANVTELSTTVSNVPKCPDPGWCVFWFLAQEDTCAEDSHCHGPLICCMWGCTKACVDADS